MNENRNELRQAFSVIENITLSASQAEKAAMVKARISRAYQLLDELEKPEGTREGDDGESA